MTVFEDYGGSSIPIVKPRASTQMQQRVLHHKQSPDKDLNRTMDAFECVKKPRQELRIDFDANVKITGRKQDMSPDQIARNLRRNNINHFRYDKSLFRDTKSRVSTLLQQMPSSSQRNALE